MDPVAGIAVRAALALLFLAAAVGKLRNVPAFRTALAGYEILPPAWCGAAAVLAIALELAVGAALLVARLGAGPPLAAAALVAVYTGAVAVNLWRGRRDIDCGCAGPGGKATIGAGLVGRNMVLLAMALVAALPASSRQLVWLDALTVAAAVAFLVVLYAAAEVARANGDRLRMAVPAGEQAPPRSTTALARRGGARAAEAGA
jgi:hypothetical protein